MGSLSSAEQRKLAYFHALGKAMTENTQAVYESKYKSSHNVRLDETWSDDVAFANTYVDAVTESNTNDAVTLFEEVLLTEIFGSNGQSYNYYSGATFVRPWISPVDIPQDVTNNPSNGYSVKLFRGDDATIGTPGSEIYITEGAWSVDYYAGIIHFGEDYTPFDLGWGSIKVTLFQYTGTYGADKNAYSTVEFVSGTTELVFNSGTTNETLVDLSYLDNIDAFTTATFYSGTTTIIFNEGLTNETTVDLSYLQSNTGTTSRLSEYNTNMVAENTTSGSTLACNIAIVNGNVTGSRVNVFINGVQVNVGSLVTDDCYFSSDGGITPKPTGSELAGDKLYWRYVGANPVSGYDLTIVDRVTFLHLTIG